MGFCKLQTLKAGSVKAAISRPAPAQAWGHDGCRLAQPCRDTPAGRLYRVLRERQPLGGVADNVIEGYEKWRTKPSHLRIPEILLHISFSLVQSHGQSKFHLH